MPSRPPRARRRLTAWEKRVRSPQFRRRLEALIAEEIRWLAGQRVRDVLDARRIRRLLAARAESLLDPHAVTDLAVEINARVLKRLAATRQSARALLGPALLRAVDTLLAEDFIFSRQVERLIARLMQQEFVRGLFTDVVYSGIVSFNQRVNPFFGGLATSVFEEQIKSFIRMFMPMLLDQATAFATHNQSVLAAFLRAVLHEVFDEPIGHLVAGAPAAQRGRVDALLREVLGGDEGGGALRDLTLGVWDDVYRRIANRRVGELLRLDREAVRLAARVADALIPVLARPSIADFLRAEMTERAQ